ncbi:MAG TPA: hypothetical protein VFC63_01995 [Blastocatellia bacterium]|nr:hypothetical protein [Blastocatellia bacterium]
MESFTDAQLATVESASLEARDLVGSYYALAPREWARLRSEVRTLAELRPDEIVDDALAHVLCYEYTRRINGDVIDQGDLYRICLQDHRILNALKSAVEQLDFKALLLYVMTHEFVHVVRFGVRLQDLNLPGKLRPIEEQNVDVITRKILSPVRNKSLNKVVEALC